MISLFFWEGRGRGENKITRDENTFFNRRLEAGFVLETERKLISLIFIKLLSILILLEIKYGSKKSVIFEVFTHFFQLR